MTVKFLPRSQLLLFAVFLEGLAVFCSILLINLSLPAVTFSTAIGAMVLVNFLHAQLISDLRHLRFFEIVAVPSLAGVIGSRSSNIAQSPWLNIWPCLPLLVICARTLEATGMTVSTEAFSTTYLLLAWTLAAPVGWFLLDGLRWRLYAARQSLSARYRPGIRLSVIGSYYACIDNFHWQSVGEEAVNAAYVAVWTSKVFYEVGTSLTRTTSSAALANVLSALLAATVSSYVSLFGFCWIVGHIYREISSKWLSSVDVILTSPQLSAQEMQRFDFSGHLFVFAYQGNLLVDPANSSSIDPLTRLLAFLLLYRLAQIPDHVRAYSHAISVEGTGPRQYYARALIEGAITPCLLGLALLPRVWRVTNAPTDLLSAVWNRNISTGFPAEFELWLHSETLFSAGDLVVAVIVAGLSTIAYPRQQVTDEAGISAHFWHGYLGTVDYGSKVYSQIVRELAGIIVHFVIMTLMFEHLWRVTVTDEQDATMLGWYEVVNFLVYFGRYADGNVRFSYTTQHGIVSDAVCSYKCVIRELPSPDEEAHKAWEDCCGICYDNEEDRLKLCVFPCLHFFHRDCIGEWLKMRMVCPMCMRKVWFDRGSVKMDNMVAPPADPPLPVTD
ncbi:hypothetical protein RvY_06736 [Ramazzottius varieornatus]|uniref:RING-type domain-containing protein n=1 Tax=Ramazzottius varieornatus TaxID=947166 RepID=A0A1D1V2Z0_RAMVA|nr:hypothetical protein RvY_06736 [Ramazzottius varieornatus]